MWSLKYWDSVISFSRQLTYWFFDRIITCIRPKDIYSNLSERKLLSEKYQHGKKVPQQPTAKRMVKNETERTRITFHWIGIGGSQVQDLVWIENQVLDLKMAYSHRQSWSKILETKSVGDKNCHQNHCDHESLPIFSNLCKFFLIEIVSIVKKQHIIIRARILWLSWRTTIHI